jgi:hypothetical protein
MSNWTVFGTDEIDAEKQRDLWLKEHPGIKINRLHPPRRESPNLLTQFSSGRSLRVSILIDFSLPEAAEYKMTSDIAEQFNELQQLRMQVYKAELALYDKAMTTGRVRADEVRYEMRRNTEGWQCNGASNGGARKI